MPTTRRLFLAGLLAVGGCAGVQAPQLQAPDVRLAALELTGLALEGQSVRATLQVDNPNGVPLPLDGLRLDLTLDGRRAARAESASAAMIPARGSGVVEVETATSLLGLAAQLAPLAQGQDVAYALTGSTLIGGLFRVTLPFEEAGRLRLTRTGSGLRLQRVEN